MKIKSKLTTQNIEVETEKAYLVKLKTGSKTMVRKLWLSKKFVYFNSNYGKLTFYLPDHFKFNLICGKAGSKNEEVNLTELVRFLAVV